MPRYSKFSAKTPKKNSNLIRENAHIFGNMSKPIKTHQPKNVFLEEENFGQKFKFLAHSAR
jgi:hypothetical protein